MVAGTKPQTTKEEHITILYCPVHGPKYLKVGEAKGTISARDMLRVGDAPEPYEGKKLVCTKPHCGEDLRYREFGETGIKGQA